MRGIDGRIIIDLDDDSDETIKTSLGSLSLSDVDENDTVYSLYPIQINQPPIITKGIQEASMPQIKPIIGVEPNRLVLYLSEDSTVRVNANQTITLRIEAIQPNILNVENGIPKLIPPAQGLTFTWRRDGVIIDSDSTFTVGGNQLTINQITIDESGLYSCDVTNDIGTTSSDDIELEVVDATTDELFRVNHVVNPIGAEDLNGWTDSVGSIQVRNLSSIPSEEFKQTNKVDYFGYTTDMFNPRPEESPALDPHNDIINYTPTSLLVDGKYFTRNKINYIQNGEVNTISAYQDIDLTEAQDYIKNSVYGVSGVRAIFSCYIGNAVSRFLHALDYMAPTTRGRRVRLKGTPNYVENEPRLSRANMIRAGIPEINETIEVLLEEYSNNTRVPTTVLNTLTNQRSTVNRISIVDPWTRVKNKYKDVTNTLSRLDSIIKDVYKGDFNNYYTLGQYVELNTVVIDKLNFNTTKVRIRLNFTTNDIRLIDTFPPFTEETDELYDIISWQKPYRYVFEEDGDTIRGRLARSPENDNKPLSTFIPKNGMSRGLVTGLNFTLVPLINP